jgi:amino acid transporter
LATEEKRLFVRDATGLTKEISGKSAMIGNIHAMGVTYFFIFAFFALLLYPGVDLPLTVLVTLVPGAIVALMYYLFTVSMPRTGGEYVWVSRVIHPSIGFMANFLVTFTFLSSISVGASWGVTYGLSPMLAAIGLISNNSGLISLAGTLGSVPTSFELTIVLQSMFVLTTLLGNKNVFRLMWGMFISATIGAIVTVLAFFATPNSTFVSNFNHFSGMNYATVISAAGGPAGFSVSATLFGSIFTVTNFFGFFTSAYFTGEVKQVNKSQVLAMFGSLFLLAAVALLIYGSAIYSAGSDFLTSLSSLAGTGSSAYTLPTIPVLNFLVAFAMPNTLVVVLSGLALLITGLATPVIFTFVCVRNLFAWSFDRIMPSSLTKLNSRGSPYVAIVLIWLFSLAFTYVYFYTTFFSFYVYATLAIFSAFMIVSIAAIAFPYRRKDVFSTSPSITQRKLAGMPLIVLLGVLGFVANAILAYATLLPSVNPPPSGPPLIQFLAYISVPVVAVAALVIYAIASAYRRREGIDLRRTFREIPPE